MNMITNNPFHLRNKTILITGASSGIGREVAIQCALVGARLVISGRDETRLNETLSALSGSGHSAICADLTDQEQLYALVDQAGEVDGVVHGAGIDGVIPIRMVSETFLDRVFSANFNAPVLLTQRLLYKKNIRDGASILFMTSIAAHTGTVGVGPYSASKAALIGLMRCLALEVAKRGIRVNSLSPGLVDTPLVNKIRAWLDEKDKMYPLGIGRPEDVAYATVYFLSDASRKITGTSFNLDGGIPFT
ncbi:SDR family oxidoreductase [Collimonas sp. H4R21]|jgi:NAD(P)-dependent dehydrogenase (short-subunit alcohol dehydrogenase family)|uniref:SDR family oxidoreductase n=1 Tax=Collimonas rhizosphaerae TaxID=3126357 RepID=A0ABU9PX00_9BURK